MATKSSKKTAAEKKFQKNAEKGLDAAKTSADLKKADAENEIPLATPTADAVTSSQIAEAIPAEAEQQAPMMAQEKHMTLTFKSLDKRGRNAIFTGAAVALRFPIGAFPNKTAPASLEIDGLAEKVAKPSRATMTTEERKAARAAQPKLTLAEKIAKQEERLAAQKAKLAAQAQPAL